MTPPSAFSSPVPSCALCAGDGGDLVWRNNALRVVIVDDPDLPGYTRVVWHAHVAEMTDLGAREKNELMQAVFLVESVQRQILQADKINLASLGNMTPHLHWHVIPRWRGDPWFPDSIWSARHECNPLPATQWRDRRRALAALREDYACALRASLDHL